MILLPAAEEVAHCVSHRVHSITHCIDCSPDHIAYGIRDTAARMKEDGDLYFQSWDAELAAMTNADLKKASSAQKAGVQAAYKEVSAKAPDVRNAYNKFMDDCTNLKTYFDRDRVPRASPRPRR